jgi:hypothetical protein
MHGVIRRLSVPQLCLLGTIVAGIGACENGGHALAPLPSGLRGHQFSARDEDTVGTFSLSIPDSGPTYTYTSGTGLATAARKIHYFKVTGYVYPQVNPDYTCCFATPTVFPAAGQSIGPAGWFDSLSDAQSLVVGVTEAGNVHPTWHTSSDLSYAVSDTELFENSTPDSVTVTRTNIAAVGSCVSTSGGCICPGPTACQTYQAGYYTMTTNQVLYVFTAPDPTVTLSPAVDTVPVNTRVLFSIVLTPSQYGSVPYDLKAYSEVWVYNGDTLSCASGCYVVASASGTVTMRALINGDSLTASANLVVQ